MGTVESIAVMIYLAADERIALKDSRFLLHSFHWGYTNRPVDYQRLAENSASLAFDTSRYISIFKERTQSAEVPVNIEQCLNSSARVISAVSAQSAGICGRVVSCSELSPIAGEYLWVDAF